MKRFVFLSVILVIAVGLFLTGCNRQSGGARSAVTLEFYFWDENQKPGMDAVVEAHTKATGVRVNTTIIPFSQYFTKLQTSLPSDSGPDVFWLNQNNATDYYPKALVNEIQSYVARDKIDLSVFPPALIDMYSYKGVLYGIPKDYDTLALFYNKAIFDAKRVPYPTDDWTFADLYRAAQRLTDDRIFGFVCTPTSQTMVAPWVFNNNGRLTVSDRRTYSYNNPEAIEALTELLKFIKDGLAPSAASLAEMDGATRFQAGLLAMITGGSWSVPPYYEALGANLGVARFPTNKRVGNAIHGLSFNFSARSKNKEEAWALVKAFATREAGDAQAMVVIPAYGGAEQTWLARWPSLNLKVFTDAAAYADRLPATSIASSMQGTVVVNYLQRMFRFEMDVAEACAALDKECEDIAKEAEAAL
jgi:multiple sugar transport system substrate-binding protein